jgi:uncharacterized membrane protein YbhN (UPF0104 family)
VLLVLRIVVPLIALGYLLSKVSLADLSTSLGLISPRAAALALAAIGLAVASAAVRWKLLFRACGIVTDVQLRELLRLHLIGMFYNTYLPGGLGGDVVRAFAIRNRVGDKGLSGSLAIVLLERILGLCGLLSLVVLSFSISPVELIPNVLFWCGLGLLAMGLSIAAITLANRWAPRLPVSLQRFARALPSIQHLGPFAVALALSVGTHGCVVLAGHLLVASIDPTVAFAESFVVMPLIGASQYFPLTVGGAGVREAAFVVFYGLVDVNKSDALAASLVYAAINFLVAAVGGVLHALQPLGAPDDMTSGKG